MDEPLRVPMDDLETDEEDLYRGAVYQGKPFTGIAFDQWKGGRSEIPYVNGMAHGRSLSWFANGKLSEEEMVDHGEVTACTCWWPPGDIVHYQKTAESDRYFYQDGSLYQERTAAYLRRFYPSGALREETLYGPEQVSLTCLAPDGAWVVKGQFPYVFQQSYSLERERMTFHNAYIMAHAPELLAAEPVMAFQRFFALWLPKPSKKKGLFSKPAGAPPELRHVICDLVRSENLHVKHYGINLAMSYCVTEAVPLLEAALSLEVIPGDYGTPETLNCTGYGQTIAQRARIALEALKK